MYHCFGDASTLGITGLDSPKPAVISRKVEEVKEELYDVHKIHGSSYAFAAIRADGQVGWQGLSAGDGDFGNHKKQLSSLLKQ